MAASPAEVLVIDASVAAKWHLSDEEYEEQALSILSSFAQGQVDLVAPGQIRYEVPAAIAVATRGRRPRLSREQGQEAIAEFLALGIKTVGDDDLVLAAYGLVHRYGCAFYDALYLALAQRLAVPFVTADAKLYHSVSEVSGVRWLGDYPPLAGA